MPAGSISIHVWDDDPLTVVYHKTSGDTHLLEPLAGVVLQLLESGSCTVDDIAIELSDIFHAHDKDQARSLIEATLMRLCDVGLASSASN